MDVAVEFFNKAFGLIIDVIEMNPSSVWGTTWTKVLDGYRIVQPVGTALLVTFFLLGFIKTTTSYMEVRRPEHVVKAILRFAIAAYICIHGAQLMADMIGIGISLTKQLVSRTGVDSYRILFPGQLMFVLSGLKLTSTPIQAIITILIAFVGMVMIIAAMISILATLYGRFFKMFMYIVIAPIPIATFAGEPTQHMGMNFAKNFASVCLECVGAAVALIVFTTIAPDILNGVEITGSNPQVNQLYEELMDKYTGCEDIIQKYQRGEISYYEMQVEIMGRDGMTEQEWSELMEKAFSSFWDRMREESIVGAYGYHRALLGWLLPIVFSLFLLSATIKAIDQITARIIGTGG